MKRLAACLILVAAVSAAAYVNTLANGFVLDDLETVVDNQAIRDWRNLGLLVSPRYFRQFGEFSYRPLATFTHFLDRGLWRLNPVGCHAVNVFLHALNAGLVSLVAFSMGRQVSAALAAGLIFSLHPVCSEVVNAVSFREDALTLAFLLLALLSYSRVFSGRSRGAGRRWYAISLLCHALSMLAKETGVVVLPLLVLRDLVGGALHRHARQSCFSEGTLLSAVNSKSEIRSTKQIQMTETAMTETGERRRPMPKRKAMFWSLGFGVLDLFRISCFGLRIWLRPRAALGSRGRLYLGYAALTAGYLFVRFHLFRNPMEAVAGKFAFHSLSGVCQIVAEYARLLLLPTNLTAHYVEPLPTGLATFVSLVFAFGLLMAATGARSRLGWFGLAWVLIALAPVAAVSPPTGHILAERYAYVAAAGFCLGLSVIARPRGRMWPALVACALLYAALVLGRNPAWKNAKGLSAQTVVTAPRSSTAWNNLACDYLQRGQFKRALVAARRAVALSPEWAPVHMNLGLACLGSGQLETARAELQKALAINPRHVGALKGLAEVHLRTEQVDDAIRVLERVVALDARDGVTFNRLGRLHLRAKSPARARECFAAAVQAAPQLAEAHNNLGSCLWQEGKLDEALAEFRKAVALDPSLVEGCYNLACVAWQRGLPDEAARYFRRVLELGGDDPQRLATAREALQALLAGQTKAPGAKRD